MQKDLNPYEFTLQIDGQLQAVRVELPKPGDYIVYINGERTAHIYPVVENTTTTWQSKDEIDQSLINEIGKHIEALAGHSGSIKSE